MPIEGPGLKSALLRARIIHKIFCCFPNGFFLEPGEGEKD
jgi:hypothetical protein